MLTPLVPLVLFNIIPAGMAAAMNTAEMMMPMMIRGVLYELADWVMDLNQDEDPKLAPAATSVVLLKKVLLVMLTSSSTRLSWTTVVRWWVVWTSFVSPDRMVTAPQLNSFDDIEQRTGTVTTAGEEIVWMTGLLDLFPLHVSFSSIVPVNSSLNDSEMTSDEGTELTLIAIEAVQMRPITCEA